MWLWIANFADNVVDCTVDVVNNVDFNFAWLIFEFISHKKCLYGVIKV